MPRRVEADLHVHTLLSACAAVEMLPDLIISQAENRGLDMIAITDHNTADNVWAVLEAAEGSSVKVLPGMECESREGIHVVCLFDNLDALLSLQEKVYAALPETPHGHESFDEQMKVDAAGEFLGFNEHLCSAPTDIALEDLIEMVRSLGGLAIPAHVDRPSMSLIAVLGFIPPDLDVPAIEVSKNTTAEQAEAKFPSLRGRTIVSSSDAHCLDDLGAGRTVLYLESRSAAEILLACRGSNGRYVERASRLQRENAP